jgi:PhnB protein
VTSIQPELWVDRSAEAVTSCQAAFGAAVLYRAGDGEDLVAQLAIGDAAFWVSTAGSAGQRIHPKAIGGATSRTLLIAGDPEAVSRHAVTAGAAPTAPGKRTQLAACPDHRLIRPSMRNRALPRPLAATLTTIGTWRMPAQAAVPSARRSPGSAPPQTAA